MPTLIVIEGSKIKTYHEFEDVEKLMKHLNHHINKAKLVIVVYKCEYCSKEYLRV